MKTNLTTDSPETKTPTLRYASLGSVSHGTLRDEDLLKSFRDELTYQVNRNGDVLNRPVNYRQLEIFMGVVERCNDLLGEDGEIPEEKWDEASEMINETLMDALQFFARPYCYFGAHPGDGADFGFWASFDEIDELPTVADSDDARALGEDCKSVNDHGNVTVYGGDGSILLELV